MEAMTQEFMLHRRPHVEIWSAREGSDDDNDLLQRQPRTLKGSISETKSLMDPKQQTMVNLRYHKTERKNQTINHYKAQPHHMSSWVHIRVTRRCLSNKRLTASHTSEDQNKTWTKHRCSSLDPITHPIRNRRLRQILTARILRRQKSRRRNGKP
jgi:hypothetical protein